MTCSPAAFRLTVYTVTVALSFCLSADICARDIFVNNLGGNDNFDGGTERAIRGSGPCQTIAKALSLAQKGDRVVIAKTSEPYRECLSVQAGRHSGLPGAPFTIVSDGAILDGSVPVPREAWSHHRGHVYRFTPRRMSHQQLFRGGLPLERVHVEASLLAPLPKLSPLQWCLHQGQVYFCCEAGHSPDEYSLSNTALLTGITLYEVRSVRIEGLVVQGYVFDGINAHDGAVDVELRSLTCRGNGRAGIAIGGASRVRVRDCLLGANAESQLRMRDFTQVLVTNTKLLESAHAPMIDRRGGQLEHHPFQAAQSDQPASSVASIYSLER